MLSFESLSGVRDRCVESFPEGEMWPHYYERRLQEFANFADQLPQKRVGKILELGCGNGYYSAFLSQIADQVVASDVEIPAIAIHVGGLDKTRRLMQSLEISNVDVVPASADKLPFEDESFDLVFSSHVMGYVSDLSGAVAEINRVLKSGGLHFCVLPTQAATLYRLIDYQFYLMGRVWAKCFSVRTSNTSVGTSARTSTTQAKRAGRFPFPAPQSGFSNWLEEFRSTSPNRWEKVLAADGKIPVIYRASTQVNPFLALGSLFPMKWAIKLHSKIRKIEAKLGRHRLAQNFGNNLLVITKKNL
jgi:ubiquinone/menaquinone biosynthesis C-methylase UbiE